MPINMVPPVFISYMKLSLAKLSKNKQVMHKLSLCDTKLNADGRSTIYLPIWKCRVPTTKHNIFQHLHLL